MKNIKIRNAEKIIALPVISVKTEKSHQNEKKHLPLAIFRRMRDSGRLDRMGGFSKILPS